MKYLKTYEATQGLELGQCQSHLRFVVIILVNEWLLLMQKNCQILVWMSLYRQSFLN